MAMDTRFRSWGYRPQPAQPGYTPSWQNDIPPLDAKAAEPMFSTQLPVGNGRSYGDSCLNRNGAVIQMTGLNRFIDFDSEAGVLRAEAGLQLNDILRIIVPKGWFLPVSPGTSYVTLGGAIANDVHGKNHHSDGTFGCFVRGFSLLTSTGGNTWCSPQNNQGLFNATIGGLGLTGVITTVELQLLRVNSSALTVQYDAFDSLEGFAQLSAQHRDHYRYTVAWMDCAGSNTAGRGVFISANHADDGQLESPTRESKLAVNTSTIAASSTHWMR